MSIPTTTTRRVALATCAEVPDLDDEGRLLRAAMVGLGLHAEPATWDDPGVDWAGYDLVVVRSTWDYAERRDALLAWAERVAGVTVLCNDTALLRWSSDKRYLADLAAAGLPVVPSHFLAPGEGTAHPWLGAAHVVKPSVGAGSRDALRLRADEAGRSAEHVAALQAAGRTALVQPYVTSVDTRGETALVYLDGAFSHAMRKGPLLREGAGLVDALFAEEEMTVREASPAELALGEACLAVLPGRRDDAAPPLYARVDLLAGEEGPLVLELELVEPSLFLDHAAGSADRLAAAVLARLEDPPATP